MAYSTVFFQSQFTICKWSQQTFLLCSTIIRK